MVEDIKKIEVENQQKNTKLKLFKGKKKILLFSLLGIFSFILILVVLIVILSLPVVNSVKASIASGQEIGEALQTQNLVLAEEKILKTEENFNEVEAKYKRLAFTKFIPILGSYYKDGESALKASRLGIDSGKILIEAVTPYADVLGFKGEGSFTGGTAEDRVAKIVETLDKVTPQIDKIVDNLVLAEEQLEKIKAEKYPKQIKGIALQDQIISGKEMVKTISQTIKDAQPALSVLPKVLGYPDERKYLVIMQNDGELRPTGGFMTAYAVIKVTSGKIEALKSDDIYSLDSKNKEKVKAPDAIARYLFSADLNTGIVPYWYLRDMNLSPDFKVSMDTFNKYYDKVPGEEEVDGIIAIDTKILKDLLSLLGPINIPGYGEFTMEADPRCHDVPQVVCEIEHIVDTPIPGIKRGRKDILGPLMKAIIAKTFDAPSTIWPSVFKLATQNLDQKHVLFYFVDEKEQEAAEKLNVAGRILAYDQDYLHVSDTNFGGAKSNLFVEHEVDQEIMVNEDGSIEKVLTLTYYNPEPMDNCNLERATGLCLNGILRNFVRVYVPKGSGLKESIGSEVEFKTYEELDKTVFEGFFELRGDGGKAKVVLTYKLPFKYDEQTGYGVLIQKQPGTEGHLYKIDFNGEQQEFNLTKDTYLSF